MASKGLTLPMLTKIISVLNKTEGRDKLGKSIQNLCRFLAYQYSETDKDLSGRFSGLQTGMSNARKLFRLFKTMNEIEKLINLAQTDSPDTIKKALDILSRAFFGGYWFFDNLVVLITVKFLKSNKEKANQTAQTFWFFGILFTQISCLYQLQQNFTSILSLKIQAQKGGEQASKANEQIAKINNNNQAQYLKLVQCFGDILQAGTGSKIFERTIGKVPNSGLIGLGGLASGLIAEYQLF